MAANHSTMMGPNTRPTLWVPRDCTANNAMMMTTEAGTISSCASGKLTLRPSTADMTEIAGVITPSPKNRQAPPIPISAMVRLTRSDVAVRCASAIRARMPPSPRLSARMTSRTYFTVTMRISDQKISERQPMISPSVMRWPPSRAMVAWKA